MSSRSCSSELARSRCGLDFQSGLVKRVALEATGDHPEVVASDVRGLPLLEFRDEAVKRLMKPVTKGGKMVLIVEDNEIAGKHLQQTPQAGKQRFSRPRRRAGPSLLEGNRGIDAPFPREPTRLYVKNSRSIRDPLSYV